MDSDVALCCTPRWGSWWQLDLPFFPPKMAGFGDVWERCWFHSQDPECGWKLGSFWLSVPIWQISPQLLLNQARFTWLRQIFWENPVPMMCQAARSSIVGGTVAMFRASWKLSAAVHTPGTGAVDETWAKFIQIFIVLEMFSIKSGWNCSRKLQFLFVFSGACLVFWGVYHRTQFHVCFWGDQRSTKKLMKDESLSVPALKRGENNNQKRLWPFQIHIYIYTYYTLYIYIYIYI